MQFNRINWENLTNDSTKEMLSCKPLDEFKGLNLSPKDITMSEEEKNIAWDEISAYIDA